jgi:hypothetical protein
MKPTDKRRGKPPAPARDRREILKRVPKLRKIKPSRPGR